SRRRHTRSKRDWSSDVCSSDLKEKDGHGHWSPVHDRIAFISGRSGKGDVYSLDLATKTTTRLTLGEQPYLYPQWSPDGKRLAVRSEERRVGKECRARRRPQSGQ